MRLHSLTAIIGDSSTDGDLGPGLRRMRHAAHALDKLRYVVFDGVSITVMYSQRSSTIRSAVTDYYSGASLWVRSIQLGVFLRRYPAARLLVILYVVLLHLWVMVVIMTYSPEMHGTHSDMHGPVHPDHLGVMTDDTAEWHK